MLGLRLRAEQDKREDLQLNRILAWSDSSNFKFKFHQKFGFSLWKINAQILSKFRLCMGSFTLYSWWNQWFLDFKKISRFLPSNLRFSRNPVGDRWCPVDCVRSTGPGAGHRHGRRAVCGVCTATARQRGTHFGMDARGEAAAPGAGPEPAGLLPHVAALRVEVGYRRGLTPNLGNPIDFH